MIISVHLSFYKNSFHGLMSPTCTAGCIKLQGKQTQRKVRGSRPLVTWELKPADEAAQLKLSSGFS